MRYPAAFPTHSFICGRPPQYQCWLKLMHNIRQLQQWCQLKLVKDSRAHRRVRRAVRSSNKWN